MKGPPFPTRIPFSDMTIEISSFEVVTVWRCQPAQTSLSLKRTACPPCKQEASSLFLPLRYVGRVRYSTTHPSPSAKSLYFLSDELMLFKSCVGLWSIFIYKLWVSPSVEGQLSDADSRALSLSSLETFRANRFFLPLFPFFYTPTQKKK